jgi:phosphoribosyl 1,2-cyclic phosphodiesterase
MKQGRPRLEAKIFISHPHWDHINALPFFAPLFVPGNEFEILGAANGDKSMRDLISAQMDGLYFPITLKEFGARVFFRDLRQESIAFDDIVVDTMLLSHPGYCLGYRVRYNGRTICYITDNELYLNDHPAYNARYESELIRFVARADVLITDCTYFDAEYKAKVDWGHSCISKVAELAAAAEVKQLHLFHHDPDQDDTAIDRKLAEAKGMLAGFGSAVDCLAPAEGTRFNI